jgi:hypothetical protein
MYAEEERQNLLALDGSISTLYIFSMAIVRTAAIGALALVPGLAAAQKSLQLPAFSSIEVSNGAHVAIRSGPAQRVTLLEGNLANSSVAVTDHVLVIDRCRDHCPRGYELEIEITVPELTKVSLANGGRVRTLGAFAPQSNLLARVAHGGTIDVRSMAAERVDAAVEQGGRILTVPRGSLIATVFQGGAVIYWGNAMVRRSIDHGGVVERGLAEELHVPLSDVGPAVVPPIPVHPVKPRR